METQKHFNRIAGVAFKGVAVALGVAVIVLNILGTLTASSAFPMLGLGMVALGIASLQK